MSNPNAEIEYQIRPVTRYIITRYSRGQRQSNGTSSRVSVCSGRGEYDNADVAYEVAYALAKADHERMGWPLDDPRIQYPRHPRDHEPVVDGTPVSEIAAADPFVGLPDGAREQLPNAA